MLFEPSYPHSVAAALELLHARLTDADPSYRTAPLRCCAWRACGPSSSFTAGRSGSSPASGWPSCSSTSSDELAEADVEIERRYFGGAAAQPHVVTQ